MEGPVQQLGCEQDGQQFKRSPEGKNTKNETRRCESAGLGLRNPGWQAERLATHAHGSW